MLRIDLLEIDDHILDKIESIHNVKFEEAEDVCVSDNRHIRKGKSGLYKVFGQTPGGRYILVVLAHKGGGNWRIATARPMTDTEKRLYKKVTGGK
jgi:uncharacterized DUF497 family protein